MHSEHFSKIFYDSIARVEDKKIHTEFWLENLKEELTWET